MNTIILLIVGILIGVGISRWCLAKKKGEEKDGCGTLVNTKQTDEKERRKAEIMKLFETQEEVRNRDVETLFQVSDATATNYLTELETEGKVRQVGVFGPLVSYKKVIG